MCLPLQGACRRPVSGVIPGKAWRSPGLRPAHLGHRPPVMPVASWQGLPAPRASRAWGGFPRGFVRAQLRRGWGDTWPMSWARNCRVWLHLCPALAVPGHQQVYGLAGPRPSAEGMSPAGVRARDADLGHGGWHRMHHLAVF